MAASTLAHADPLPWSLSQWSTDYPPILEPDCVTAGERVDRPVESVDAPATSRPVALAEILRIPEWWDRANCLGMDPNAFHARDSDQVAVAAARLVCQGCDMQVLCLERAIEIRTLLGRDHDHGVWGGTTPKERGKIVAARRRQAVDSSPHCTPTRRSATTFVCSGCGHVWSAAHYRTNDPAPRPCTMAATA